MEDLQKIIDEQKEEIEELKGEISELEDKISSLEDDLEIAEDQAEISNDRMSWDDRQVESMNDSKAAELILEYWEYITLEDIESLLKSKGLPV